MPVLPFCTKPNQSIAAFTLLLLPLSLRRHGIFTACEILISSLTRGQHHWWKFWSFQFSRGTKISNLWFRTYPFQFMLVDFFRFVKHQYLRSNINNLDMNKGTRNAMDNCVYKVLVVHISQSPRNAYILLLISSACVLDCWYIGAVLLAILFT